MSIEKAAQLGAEHSQFIAVRQDPIAWLADESLETVAYNAGVDLTDKAEWDAYCAALYLGLLPSSARPGIVRAVITAERALTG